MNDPVTAAASSAVQGASASSQTTAEQAAAAAAERSNQINALLAKGAAGGLFFRTDDVQADYEELKGRGVEFAQEPTKQPYGIDAGFRDPSGNHFRLAQMVE